MYSMEIFEKTTKCCGLKIPSKKVHKIAKKVLTKGVRRGIIAKLSRERVLKRSCLRDAAKSDRFRRYAEMTVVQTVKIRV